MMGVPRIVGQLTWEVEKSSRCTAIDWRGIWTQPESAYRRYSEVNRDAMMVLHKSKDRKIHENERKEQDGDCFGKLAEHLLEVDILFLE
jgi:hypothetical protein